jgi:CO/xanthine dehydrogenase Mo-binding subunit
VLPDGKVELVMGTMSSGQGHETSFAQLVTEWLGVPFESIVYAPAIAAQPRFLAAERDILTP